MFKYLNLKMYIYIDYLNLDLPHDKSKTYADCAC